MNTTSNSSPQEKILFFDGICVMCNRLIRFVLQYDKKHDVQFATLQGHVAETRVPVELRSQLKTVVFFDSKGVHTEADAIIRLLIAMGGIFHLARLGFIFPRFIRNGVYAFVANNRYRWFGTTESCALLSPEQKRRILD